MMNSLQTIAKIANLPFDANNFILMNRLQRIQSKLPLISTDFDAAVLKADAEVTAVGVKVIDMFVQQITAPIPERVLKIKSSPKGVRIAVAAANGVRFSFGPIWNVSVSRGKGIAFADANREKLNHQGLMLGIDKPEEMTASALGVAIAATF